MIVNILMGDFKKLFHSLMHNPVMISWLIFNCLKATAGIFSLNP